MENTSLFEKEQHSSFDSFELQISEQAKGYLKETAGWATFLAIIGFIVLALGFFMGIFYMTMMDSILAQSGQATSGGMDGLFTYFGLVIMLGSLMGIFPLVYLLKFASKIKSAINSNNNDKLTQAFGSLKSHYKFVGILTIIGIALYILTIIFTVIFGISKAAGL